MDPSGHRADHSAPLQRRISVRCRDLARAYDLPLQTHLAETKAQAVLGLRKYGKTLTAHLDSLGMLGPHLSAAHAIWLDRDDLDRLASNGASVVHAPVSNMRFGSGLAHLRPMLDRGINVGVATDAANSSDQLNMFESTRLATLISRVQTPDFKTWLGADEVLRMATAGSAHAMGFGGRSAKSRQATKPISSFSISATSITCLATISSARLSSPRTVPRSIAS